MSPPLATAETGVALLTTLTTGASDTATGPMNPLHIRDCKGLLFTEFVKTGAVVGFEQNSGYLIVKKEDGSWSAPAFVGGKGFTLGVTAGHSKISSVMVLYSDKSIAQARKKFKVGVDFNVTIGKLDLASKEMDLGTITGTDACSWTVGQGVLIDLSLSGGQVQPDEARNAEAYGAGKTPDEILESAAQPADFAPLYAKLQEVASRAGLKGQVVPPNPVSVGAYERML